MVRGIVIAPSFTFDGNTLQDVMGTVLLTHLKRR